MFNEYEPAIWKETYRHVMPTVWDAMLVDVGYDVSLHTHPVMDGVHD